jgi:histone H3
MARTKSVSRKSHKGSLPHRSQLASKLARKSVHKKDLKTKVVIKEKVCSDGITRKYKQKSDGTWVRLKRNRPGTVAKRDVRYLQRSTHLILAKSPVNRLVHEIMLEFDRGTGLKIGLNAVRALQEAGEQEQVKIFGLADLARLHREAGTVSKEDFRFAESLYKTASSSQGPSSTS